MGEILEKVGLRTSPPRPEGRRMTEARTVLYYMLIERLLPLPQAHVSSPLHRVEWCAFQNGLSSLGSQVIQRALSLMEKKRHPGVTWGLLGSSFPLPFSWIPTILSPKLYFLNHVETP